MGYFFGKIFKIFIIIYVGVLFYQNFRPFPETLRTTPVDVSVSPSSIIFFADETYMDKEGKLIKKQTIFNEVLKMIHEAHSYILVDMFLFNEFGATNSITDTAGSTTKRDITKELTDALVLKKTQSTSTTIIFITDPINTVYGGVVSPELAKLQEAGVLVVNTNLTPLPDSNRFYSPIYRMLFQWKGNTEGKGWLPNPFDGNASKVTLRSYFNLLNAKANHRKLIVADSMTPKKEQTVSALIMSMNPHTASDAHWNVALRVDSHLWKELLYSESRVVKSAIGAFPDLGADRIVEKEGESIVTLYTENEIETHLVKLLTSAKTGDKISMATFYLSDRRVMNALKTAVVGGAKVRIILDANKDAFGHDKHGIPNRQSANILFEDTQGGIEIRWCNTHGEQCHGKMVLADIAGSVELLLGSANFTRRNIGGYNYETDVAVRSVSGDIPATKKARETFERWWGNTDGIEYTLPYQAYAESKKIKNALSWWMEWSGMSTF